MLHRRPRPRRGGFTLIELLVVIAIIAAKGESKKSYAGEFEIVTSGYKRVSPVNLD
jgi:prepilin-type N-terminal cleavage/methylation domain-containing protein